MLFFASPLSLLAQGASSSTISAAGVTGLVQGKYYSHVIGQASVVAGTTVRNGVTVRQGFKQPNLLARSIQKSGLKIQVAEENPISYQVFPNPFVDRVTVRFDRPTANPVILNLYDSQGNIVWQGDYPEQMKEIKLDKFQDIKAGKYILQVFQKGKPISQSLLKNLNP
jgi:hypothetical protein